MCTWITISNFVVSGLDNVFPIKYLKSHPVLLVAGTVNIPHRRDKSNRQTSPQPVHRLSTAQEVRDFCSVAENVTPRKTPHTSLGVGVGIALLFLRFTISHTLATTICKRVQSIDHFLVPFSPKIVLQEFIGRRAS